MKKKFCCDASSKMMEQYYKNQAGNGSNIFVGARGQRGHGFGSILGSLFRSAAPILKSVGQQAIRTGAQIATDVASGKNFSESANQRLRQGVIEGINTFIPTETAIPQSGCGLKRTYKRKRRAAAKKIKSHNDIFG